MTQTRPSHSRLIDYPLRVGPRRGPVRSWPPGSGGPWSPPPGRARTAAAVILPGSRARRRRDRHRTCRRRRGPVASVTIATPTPGRARSSWSMSSRPRTRIIVAVASRSSRSSRSSSAPGRSTRRASPGAPLGASRVAGRPVGGLTETELRVGHRGARRRATRAPGCRSRRPPATSTPPPPPSGLDARPGGHRRRPRWPSTATTAPSPGRSRGCGRSSPSRASRCRSPSTRPSSPPAPPSSTPPTGSPRPSRRSPRRRASIRWSPGIDGAAIDPAALADLARRGRRGGRHPDPGRRSTRPRSPPTFTDADAQAVADQANAATADAARPRRSAARAPPILSETLRSWLTAVPGADRPRARRPTRPRSSPTCPTLVTDLGVAPVPATFNVHRRRRPVGKVEIVDGQLGVECCAPDSADAHRHRARRRPDHRHARPVADRPRARQGVGREPRHHRAGRVVHHHHPAGEPRVTNIHRIADIARGMVIEPGEVFSLNERVGKRTDREGLRRGAGDLQRRAHRPTSAAACPSSPPPSSTPRSSPGSTSTSTRATPQIIDRYPTGREATVSWPSPDLKIRNDTPYGILIWTSYTDTSITVTLYSTPWVAGEQTGQTTEPKGPCTRVHHRAHPHLGRRPHRRRPRLRRLRARRGHQLRLIRPVTGPRRGRTSRLPPLGAERRR